MKTLLVLMAAIFISAGTHSFAQTNPDFKSTELNLKQIEENYLRGLSSEVPGLQISCAYFLGEMKSDRAVIPLLRMLRDKDATAGQRIMAAWSLCKIGDGRGMRIVRLEAEDSEIDYLRSICQLLNMDHDFKASGYDLQNMVLHK